MKITKILKQETTNETTDKSLALRVAAYCRVSTKHEGQEGSYTLQVAAYKQMINSTPGWTLAGIYADYGMSGTQARKRPDFLRMIKDCEAGLIDVIICKSLSRFSRNSMDALTYIRKLEALGIRLIFEKEGIDTGDSLSEMLITVFSAFAQEESRSLSDNVKWARRKRMESGEGFDYAPYGFRKRSYYHQAHQESQESQAHQKNSNDSSPLEIIPEEAKVVKKIFTMYEHGESVNTIISTLMKNNIEPPGFSYSGSMTWDKTRIHYILQNEKYIGDLKTQKSYTVNYITRKKVKNNGDLPQFYFHDHHIGFITRKQFERCNKIFKMRLRTPYQSYPFGNLLRCPYCGHVLTAHKLGTFHNDRHFCCEGEGACCNFVIRVKPVEEAILRGYNEFPSALRPIPLKSDQPSFDKIDFWWLDETVERFEFGQHTCLASQLKHLSPEEREAVDDCVICIFWKNGEESRVPIEHKSDWQNPKDRARRWNEYLQKSAKPIP